MYREIIEELIARQEPLFRQVSAGDGSAVRYCPKKDPVHGTYDQNYAPRLRLAYYLLLRHTGSEELARCLFEEEVKDREQNSFQGIGSALEILTILLRSYNTDGRYDPLFRRAKEANFDCACGYDPEQICAPSLEMDSFDNCIAIAGDMDDPEAQARLIDVWKGTVAEWTEREYETLVRCNRNCGRERENLQSLQALVELRCAGGSNRDRLTAWRNLIAYDVKFARWEEGYGHFEQMRRSADLSQIEHIRFFGDFLELCMDMICGSAAHRQALWAWARPYIKARAGGGMMYGNLYQKCIAAADAVEDPMAGTLREHYAAWKEQIKL